MVLTSKYAAGVAALALSALALTSTPAAAAQPRASITLNGAGSTFVYPMMSGQWIPNYQKIHPDVQINYQAIGSGAGISLFTKGQVNFAASDAAASAAQDNIAKLQCGGGAGGGVFHLPVTIGAVALIYNLSGVSNLKLSPSVVAGIFLGQITNWSDGQIKSLNPGVTLPSIPIQTVHRADGSGTTWIFTHYLAAISSTWKSQIGAGATTVSWPNGTGAQGSSGVSAAVGQQQGTISYVDLAYAITNKLSYAQVQNKKGQFIAPSSNGASLAADAYVSQLPSSNEQVIVDAPVRNAYPISGYSYIFMCNRQPGLAGRTLVDFVRYVVTTGQKAATALYYAPLPTSVVKRDQVALGSISLH